MPASIHPPPARALRALAAALALAPAALATAQPAAAPDPVHADSVLAGLLAESLAARPELRQAEATARAERERVPQAGALPDPCSPSASRTTASASCRSGRWRRATTR